MSTIQVMISAVLALLVMVGISMMSRVQTAVRGNLLSAFAMLVGVVATLVFSGVVSAWTIWPAIAIGALIGSLMARRVQMIQMPQTVALFNGLGGGASALVGMLSVMGVGFSQEQMAAIVLGGYFPFVLFTGLLAVAVGLITLVGSLVAAGKLHRVLPQQPLVWPHHSLLTLLFLAFTVLFVLVGTFSDSYSADTRVLCLIGTAVAASLFGLYFSVRVGGADMPITISLLNSLSGVAGSIAGMAISDVFLVAVGGIVGASGLLLTQIMCQAMNRSLLSILVGAKKKAPLSSPEGDTIDPVPVAIDNPNENEALIKRVMDLEKRIQELEAIVKNLEDRVKKLQEAPLSSPGQEAPLSSPEGDTIAPSNKTIEAPSGAVGGASSGAVGGASSGAVGGAATVLAAAKDVIIVPGYGMALAQAQHQVRQLADKLESRGARVRFAIHPVAGRMPGHMNVLLAEADVDYEKLYEMDAINDDFAKSDCVIVIGASDVLNPAARHAEGTPIYGMPVLNVDQAPEVIICNYDLKPGYAGVENPIYTREKGVYLELGDAKETLMRLMNAF